MDEFKPKKKVIKPKKLSDTPPPEKVEKPRLVDKIYKFRDIELKPKKLTFALRKASLELISDYRAFAKKYLTDSTTQLLANPRPDRAMYKTDDEFNTALQRYILSIQAFNESNTLALMIYLSDAEKLSEVFNTFFEGEVSIDFETVEPLEQDQLMGIGAEVVNGFFSLIMKSVLDARKL